MLEQHARVARVDRGQATIISDGDAIRVPTNLPLAVGDWVRLGPPAELELLPRHTELVRRAAGGALTSQVLAANVDLALIVHGLDRPLNTRRLQRFSAIAWDGGVEPVVVLAKTDLVDDVAAEVRAAERALPGVPVFAAVGPSRHRRRRRAAAGGARRDARPRRPVRRRQVDHRQPPDRRGAHGDGRRPPRRQGPPHDDAPRARASSRAAPCSSTRPASAGSPCGTPRPAWSAPSRTSASSREACRFARLPARERAGLRGARRDRRRQPRRRAAGRPSPRCSASSRPWRPAATLACAPSAASSGAPSAERSASHYRSVSGKGGS